MSVKIPNFDVYGIHAGSRQFVEAFGLDASRVTSLTLKVRSDSLVMLEVTMYAEKDDMDRGAEVARRYHLVPIKDDGPGGTES